MTALLLRLAAPLQSWGTSSRFVRRNTDRAPSKSGIIGLLAAAQGRRRTDPIEDLVGLRIGARVEQEGRLERDFQTAHADDGTAMPLSYRFYLSDAVFLVAVEGDRALLEGLREALRRPVFPLFLGRKSCPPAGRLDQGLREGTVEQVLAAEDWCASEWLRRRRSGEDTVTLHVVHDCPPGTVDSDVVRDEPVSFDPRHRVYGWRTVTRRQVRVSNPDHQPGSGPDPHDPMELLENVT